MARFLKIFVAVLCIVCILALCIAPFVDIPVTVLKVLQVVVMLMFGMSSVLLLCGVFDPTAAWTSAARAVDPSPTLWSILPLETNCVHRC